MTRHLARTAVAAALVAFASVSALPSPAAAQEAAEPKAAPVAGWEYLPGTIAEGAKVVVRTRDGQASKGRVRSLSDTAIVIDSGKLVTIPAVAVESIEGDRGGRRVKRGVVQGAKIGAGLSAAFVFAWLFQPHDGPCTSEDCVTGGDVLFGMVFLPAAGAAIGAGVGALTPGERRVLYARAEHGSVAIAPIAGHGRHGAQLRVVF